MAIRGAIFDMDGTLTESMHLWIEIGRRYLEGLGYTVSPEQNREMTKMLLEPMALYMQDQSSTRSTRSSSPTTSRPSSSNPRSSKAWRRCRSGASECVSRPRPTVT